MITVLRPWALLSLLVSSLCYAQGPYSLLLENGDSLQVPSYRLQGDTLLHPQGKLAKRDILLVRSRKGRSTFNAESGALSKLDLDGYGTPCGMGKVYAEKYADSGYDLGTFTLPDTALLHDQAFIDCWRSQLGEHDIPTDSHGHLYPSDRKDHPEYVYQGNMIIKRNGDTLRVDGDLYATDKRQVCWYGGGGCVPLEEIYLVLNKRGQCVVKEKTHSIVATGLCITDRAPCSQALVYAQIYAGIPGTLNDVPNLDRALKDDPDFFECYYQEQARIAKKGEGWRTAARIVSTAGGVYRGGSEGLRNASSPMGR